MVKLLIDLLEFLRSCAPLFTSLTILTVSSILLSKSIKKHAIVYYIIFAIPFFLVALPSIGRMLGIEVPSLTRIPLLGEIIRDYIHMGTFGHPLLIIIMYMGALDPKRPNVKKLLTIRKELSIISGFAVFAHSLIRVVNNLPGSVKFFTNNAEYMANTKVASELGAGISSFSFILGVFMLIIFIPLWVTSFDGIRKRMGYTKWKKWQRWSYVLYATLFIHAVGIQIGGMLNPRGGSAPKPAVEVTATVVQARGAQGETAKPATEERRGEHNSENVGHTTNEKSNNRDGNVKQAPGSQTQQRTDTGVATHNGQKAQAAAPSTSGRMPTKGFADFKVNAGAKRYIHLISLILIYGSYLYLRLRKAKRDAQRRSKSVEINA